MGHPGKVEINPHFLTRMLTEKIPYQKEESNNMVYSLFRDTS